MTVSGQRVTSQAKADDQSFRLAPDVANLYREVQVALQSLQRMSKILERIAMTIPSTEL